MRVFWSTFAVSFGLVLSVGAQASQGLSRLLPASALAELQSRTNQDDAKGREHVTQVESCDHFAGVWEGQCVSDFTQESITLTIANEGCEKITMNEIIDSDGASEWVFEFGKIIQEENRVETAKSIGYILGLPVLENARQFTLYASMYNVYEGKPTPFNFSLNKAEYVQRYQFLGENRLVRKLDADILFSREGEPVSSTGFAEICSLTKD